MDVTGKFEQVDTSAATARLLVGDDFLRKVPSQYSFDSHRRSS